MFHTATEQFQENCIEFLLSTFFSGCTLPWEYFLRTGESQYLKYFWPEGFLTLEFERLLLKDKTPGFLASRGDEFNPGPEMRPNHYELLCNKVLLELEKASNIGIRGGRKSTPLLVFRWMLYSHSQSVNGKKRMS